MPLYLTEDARLVLRHEAHCPACQALVITGHSVHCLRCHRTTWVGDTHRCAPADVRAQR